jgi:predicted metalloprotease
MRQRPRRLRITNATRGLVLAVVVALTLTACGTVNGSGKPGVVDTAGNVSNSTFPIVGDAGTQFDQLVRNSLVDIEQFWTDAYPLVSGGKPFKPLTGGVYSVETNKPNTAEECMRRSPKAANNNAFYCPLDDAFAYDRIGVVKSIADDLGPNFVPLVFAHETGHLIQDRLSIDSGSIYLETQADCASGAFMAAEAGSMTSTIRLKDRHFYIDPANLDGVAIGMILLRDSQPQSSTANGAHGNGFDRLSAFSDGFNNGVKYCYSNDWSQRQFTERPYTSADDYNNQGNLSLADTLNPTTGPIGDLNRFWTSAFQSINKTFKTVAVKQADSPPCAGESSTKFTYCASDNTVYYSSAAASEAYDSVPVIAVSSSNKVTIKQNAPGDYALGAMFAYMWGMAVRAQFGLSTDGQDALIAASCYVGAYSKDINVTTGRPFTLSPPDMDEATVTTLRTVGKPDFTGMRNTTGFQRIRAFNKGYFGSLTAC